MTAVTNSEAPPDAADLGEQLGNRMDLDYLNSQNFLKHAGVDQELDRAEFDKFTKTMNLPRPLAAKLWALLDEDGSGKVSISEFKAASASLQRGRVWLRLCPTCTYSNACAFCHECNANCPRSARAPLREHARRGGQRSTWDGESVGRAVSRCDRHRLQSLCRVLDRRN